MKKYMIFIMMMLLGVMASACKPVTISDGHNARNSLDWAGVYRGVLPCEDCDGIETVVVLQADEHYRIYEKSLGKDAPVVENQGQLVWNKAGDRVTLSSHPKALEFFIGENHIIQYALYGMKRTGDLAEQYTLTKMTEDITEKYWKLVELNGQPIPNLSREVHLILKAEDNRVIGFGGCNRLMGGYEIVEALSRINFTHIASTKMACPAPAMDIENAFVTILGNVDNYTFDGERLTLNRARMAPLARFEVVYLY